MKATTILLMLLVLFLPTAPAQEQMEWVPTECDSTVSVSFDEVPVIREITSEIQFAPDGTRLAIASFLAHFRPYCGT